MWKRFLSHFGYKDNKPFPTPYDPSLVLRKNKIIGRDQLKYSHIIGSLMYLASVTRPDISFVVSKLKRTPMIISQIRSGLLLIQDMIIGVRLSELCTTWLVQ
jgi:hypothetical protein